MDEIKSQRLSKQESKKRSKDKKDPYTSKGVRASQKNQERTKTLGPSKSP